MSVVVLEKFSIVETKSPYILSSFSCSVKAFSEKNPRPGSYLLWSIKFCTKNQVSIS